MSDRYIYNSKKLVLVFISLCAITMLQLAYFIRIITNVQNDNFKLKLSVLFIECEVKGALINPLS